LRSAISAPYTQRFRGGAALLALLISLVFAGSASAATTLSITGGGNGHGIGLSQYGAYGYALHGKSYRWILAHYYRGTKIGTVSPRTTVRVLLSGGQSAFAGATKAVGATGRGATKLHPGTTYMARPDADGTVTIVDLRGKKIGRFTAPVRVTGPAPLSLARVGTYRGAFELRPDGQGGIETVDAVGVDDYVRGVISAEMPSGWSAQALRAQAVAARTYAITSDVGGAAFDLYPDTRSQMYKGVAAETPATDAAVAATRGQVVTDHGDPVITYFFASSGGHTENIEDAWPGSQPEPWLRGVVDRYDGAGGDPYHRWTRSMSVAQATTKLGGLVKGRLVRIVVTKHGVSPRIVTAVVVGTKGRTTVTGAQLQQAFGLLSTYARFTMLTTDRGRAPQHLRGKLAPALAVESLMPVFRDLVFSGVHGSLSPPPKSGTVEVQRQTRHGWKTVGHARLRDGRYDTAVPAPGNYRVVYEGGAGPTVTLP
jgi:stage II sporulation protein D